MTQADKQYNELVKNILENGYTDEDQKVRTVWKDGSPAHTLSIIDAKFTFDNSEVPILTSKAVAWKTSILEILWIWQQKSNVVADLQKVGVHIWDEWTMEDGTIGKAYGYQLGKKCRKLKQFDIPSQDKRIESISFFKKIDQVDYLLDQLVNNPSSRRHITTLWNIDDLDDMSLNPCVHSTQWFVKENKLHLTVKARSQDMALGNPFNVFQYNVLQRMIAQVTGYELGEYNYTMGDAHVYTRHIEDITKQIEREPFEAPQLWINPEVKNFYDFTIDDFKLIGYKHGEKIPYEVAI